MGRRIGLLAVCSLSIAPNSAAWESRIPTNWLCKTGSVPPDLTARRITGRVNGRTHTWILPQGRNEAGCGPGGYRPFPSWHGLNAAARMPWGRETRCRDSISRGARALGWWRSSPGACSPRWIAVRCASPTGTRSTNWWSIRVPPWVCGGRCWSLRRPRAVSHHHGSHWRSLSSVRKPSSSPAGALVETTTWCGKIGPSGWVGCRHSC
ncbi:Uncharacterised protein [Mycobacteroides abscessus subsp. bolletii]|nr:Uncharacterised protein [Mycobacteroides abscessus subsp. bolletii]